MARCTPALRRDAVFPDERLQFELVVGDTLLQKDAILRR